MGPSAGVSNRVISQTPVSIVDIETTGLSPGGDRILELAVVRIEPGGAPNLIFDTLINPRRRVSATEIHGITDDDVVDAPPFEDVAGNVTAALAGSVIAAYNVYFDARFIQHELSRVGVAGFPPHLCLMYLRPMLGLGRRCSLEDACRSHGIHGGVSHHAANDALSGAGLWSLYLDSLGSRGIRTFGELANLKAYKFTNSFSEDLLSPSVTGSLRMATRLKSRSSAAKAVGVKPVREDKSTALGEYWDALTGALADLVLTGDEIEYLKAKRTSLQLTDDEVRWLHGRAVAGILADMSTDHAIDAAEATSLHGIMQGLRALGWAPGDSPNTNAGTMITPTVAEENKPEQKGWFRFWR